MPFQKGHKLGKGRPQGSLNKTYNIIPRVITLCAKYNFHPADVLIKICRDERKAHRLRIEAAKILLEYLEGKQQNSLPHVAQTPRQSVQNINNVQKFLEKLSEPITPGEEIKEAETNPQREGAQEENKK